MGKLSTIFAAYYNHPRCHESMDNFTPPMLTTGAVRKFYQCGRTSSGVRSNGTGICTTNGRQFKRQTRWAEYPLNFEHLLSDRF